MGVFAWTSSNSTSVGMPALCRGEGCGSVLSWGRFQSRVWSCIFCRSMAGFWVLGHSRSYRAIAGWRTVHILYKFPRVCMGGVGLGTLLFFHPLRFWFRRPVGGGADVKLQGLLTRYHPLERFSEAFSPDIFQSAFLHWRNGFEGQACWAVRVLAYGLESLLLFLDHLFFQLVWNDLVSVGQCLVAWPWNRLEGRGWGCLGTLVLNKVLWLLLRCLRFPLVKGGISLRWSVAL